VAKPTNPAMARQIQAGVVMDTQPQAFDASATRRRYPSIPVTKVSGRAGPGNVELIAPAVGGLDDSDGTHAPGRPEDRLFEAAGLGGLTDDGFVSLDEHSAADFISRCAKLRFWPRQASVAQRAGAAKASAGQG
jgi:hypothetical protein